MWAQLWYGAPALQNACATMRPPALCLASWHADLPHLHFAVDADGTWTFRARVRGTPGRGEGKGSYGTPAVVAGSNCRPGQVQSSKAVEALSPREHLTACTHSMDLPPTDSATDLFGTAVTVVDTQVGRGGKYIMPCPE